MGARIHNADRYPSGRLKTSQAVDRGNPRIAAMRQLFDAKCFQKGGRGKEAYDGIGQLWLIGKLEGYPVESVRLMDVGREFGRLYHQQYSDMAAGIAKYDNVARSTDKRNKYGPLPRKTRDDTRFERMNDTLDLYSDERKAIYELVCRYHNTDGICDWAARIIGDALLSKGFVFDLMELSNRADHDMLQAAIRGLFALHDGEMPGRLERVAA
jgi:hypothetical protein